MGDGGGHRRRRHLDRLAPLLRLAAEPPPERRPRPAAGHGGFRERGSGDARQPLLRASHPAPAGRRHQLPAHDGLRRHRRPGLRPRVRAHHGGGGARARRAPELRPGSRRQLQSREPHHQHPCLRRGPGGGGAAGDGVHRGCARGRRAHHGEALSGSRRHPHRLAHRAPDRHRGQGAPGGDGAGALPAGRVGRRGRGDDGSRRGARHPGERCAGDAVALLPHGAPARGHGVRWPDLHGCTEDGRDLARDTGRGSGGAGP